MRVLIVGMDGYLGWPLALHLLQHGHEVAGCDVFFRRKWVEEMGSWSAIPIRSMSERLAASKEVLKIQPEFREIDAEFYADWANGKLAAVETRNQ